MKNKELYTDNNPKTTIKVYFKNKEGAIKSIKKISHRSKTYQLQVLITLYYRAKYHPHQTKEMREAMSVFKKRMKEIKKTVNIK